MRPPRYMIPLAAAAALVLGVAGPASAAVTVTGQSVTGDGANDNIAPFCSAGVLASPGAATTGDPCANMIAIQVNPGAGTDTVNLSNVTRESFPAHIANLISASDGLADTLTGSPLDDDIQADGFDIVSAGDGNDRIASGSVVNGGGGDDTISEFAGDVVALGGSGDDRFVDSGSDVGVDGGPGVDSFEWDLDRLVIALGVTTTWTLTPAGLSITGIGVEQVVPMAGIEEVIMTMFKGDVQVVDGTAFPGRLHIRGMGGPDDLRGGGFADSLAGGSGNDTVTGNGGADELSGGDGDDTIQARDGVADQVDCGLGADTAVADASDTVANCENVQLPPLPPPPPPPAPVVPVTGKIKGPDSVTQPAKAKFKFSSPTAGATFQCKLDKKRWKACTSPHKVKTSTLEVGKHRLKVRAVLNGVVDASPSKATFRVRKG